MLENPAGVDEGPSTDSRAVFAELHTGELVLIAVDANWREGSLHKEIEEAINVSRGDSAL